jgi:hypothetical protein
MMHTEFIPSIGDGKEPHFFNLVRLFFLTILYIVVFFNKPTAYQQIISTHAVIIKSKKKSGTNIRLN